MTSEQWETAPEVESVAAQPVAEISDTEPAPPPTEPNNERPTPLPYVPRYVGTCSFCDRYGGDHDAACPLSKAVEP